MSVVVQCPNCSPLILMAVTVADEFFRSTALCTKSGSTGKHVCSKGCNHLVSEPSTPDNQQMAVCQVWYAAFHIERLQL